MPVLRRPLHEPDERFLRRVRSHRLGFGEAGIEPRLSLLESALARRQLPHCSLRLVKGGLCRGDLALRGPPGLAGGGFALARPAGDISLADIVEAVEGPISLTMCSDSNNHECILDAHCRVKPHIGVVGNAVRGALGAVRLTELAR